MPDNKNSLVNLTEQDEADIILRTCILFMQTTREVTRYGEFRLQREADISLTKFIVLMAINQNNGVMRPSEIARWTQTEPHNITTLIRRMKKDGLITAKRDYQNKRAKNVALTDKGRDALARVKPVATKIVDRVMSSITKKDAGLLEILLKTMIENARSGLDEITSFNSPETRKDDEAFQV